jgi:hypothetical protein
VRLAAERQDRTALGQLLERVNKFIAAWDDGREPKLAGYRPGRLTPGRLARHLCAPAVRRWNLALTFDRVRGRQTPTAPQPNGGAGAWGNPGPRHRLGLTPRERQVRAFSEPGLKFREGLDDAGGLRVDPKELVGTSSVRQAWSVIHLLTTFSTTFATNTRLTPFSSCARP